MVRHIPRIDVGLVHGPSVQYWLHGDSYGMFISLFVTFCTTFELEIVS